MTQVIHGLTREQLAENVYGDSQPPVPKKRRKKKYNATQAMVMWIDGLNQLYGEDPSRVRAQEERRVSACHQPVKRG